MNPEHELRRNLANRDRRQSTLQYCRRLVERLKQGENVVIGYDLLCDLPTAGPFDNRSPQERILEGIIGSAYSIKHEQHPMMRGIRFERLTDAAQCDLIASDLRTFVSDDRRHLFHPRPDGFYESILPLNGDNHD
jgi:hypothetical protein